MRALARKAHNYFWPNRRKFEGIVVGLSILLLVLYQFVDRTPYVNFTVQENVLILSIFILLFLEGMATELTRATNQLRSDVSIIPGQGDASELKRMLSEYVEESRPNEVRMIEYSSSTVDSIIEDAVQEGAEIKLLLKHPDSAIPKNQPEKILGQVRDLHSDLNAYSNIEFRFYRQHAGLRARKFDDDLINCGWYTYQYNESRGTHLKGHINPTVLVSADEKEEYGHVEQMFDRVFANLWKHGSTLEEFYQNPDEYDSNEMERFRGWVEHKGCEQWIQAVSDTDADANTIEVTA